MNTTNDTKSRVELRNVKHSALASQETEFFTATVYIDGQKAGTVQNDGQGGSNLYHPWAVQDRLEEIAKTMPDLEPINGVTLRPDADTLIGDILNAYLDAKRFNRLMKNKTVFRLKDDNVGDWRTLNGGPYSPAAKEWLVKKYGDRLGEIMNERKAAS